MPKYPVKLHVTGTKTCNNDSTVNDFFVDGKLRCSGDSICIEYAEPCENSVNGINTVVSYNGEILNLSYEGMRSLIVEKDSRHICHMLTPLGNVMVGVSGGRIDVKKSRRRVDMEIDYAIDINTVLFSRNNIKIRAERTDV